MDTKKKIEIALSYCGMSKAELARRLGTTPQNLGKKLAVGKLRVEDWEQIAAAMGARFEINIIFPDGWCV